MQSRKLDITLAVLLILSASVSFGGPLIEAIPAPIEFYVRMLCWVLTTAIAIYFGFFAGSAKAQRSGD